MEKNIGIVSDWNTNREINSNTNTKINTNANSNSNTNLVQLLL